MIDKDYLSMMTKLIQAKELTREEFCSGMEAILDGTLSEVRMSALLTAFENIDINPNDFSHFLQLMRKKHAPSLSLESKCVDFYFEAEERDHTPHWGVMASLIVHSLGVNICKMCDRGFYHRAGVADFIEALNIPLMATFDEASLSKFKKKPYFISPHALYPHLKHLFAIRKSLMFPTLLDKCLPFLNPWRGDYFVMSVGDRELGTIYAKILQLFHVEKSIVIIENEQKSLPTCSALLVQPRALEVKELPNPFFCPSDAEHQIAWSGMSIDDQVVVFLDVLRGHAPETWKKCILTLASFLLWVTGREQTLEACYSKCQDALESNHVYSHVSALSQGL